MFQRHLPPASRNQMHKRRVNNRSRFQIHRVGAPDCRPRLEITEASVIIHVIQLIYNYLFSSSELLI